MDLLTFAELVERMRTAQKTYFRSRQGTPEKAQALEDSKRLEREVDAAAKAITAPPKAPPALF